ncbi:MAG TPA: adenylate/guanylate cyclase domain-containing protein [Alphaproteobacteria bacterium]|nr:adenylate/guanylate cyclase domain-containing protein [Alphaproteobacteria bacterium]
MTAEPGPRPDIGAVREWILQEGRLIPDTAEFLEELGQTLIRAGIPLIRATLHTRTLHPQVLATIWLWRRGERGSRLDREHGIEVTEAYLQSPVRVIYEGAGAVRRRLDGAEEELDFPVLREVKALGASDYVALPLRFTGGVTAVATFATDRAGGFTSAELAALDRLMPYVALVLEVQAKTRVLTTLLDIYLGHDAGRRVLAGTIRRGDAQRIYAVLWYCDLRNSTELAQQLDPTLLIETLNTFFAAMGGAVESAGGDILKFIGDAMLAIFPIEELDYCHVKAKRALAAGAAAQARLAAINEARREAGERPLACGIALHVGDVYFGNVGAPTRLDFTVIGQAVNCATRIEDLCKQLGEPLLISGDLARHIDRPLRSRGAHLLRGIADPVEVFAPGGVLEPVGAGQSWTP